ncbi:ABC transporter permease subunit [Chengkuizengella axinellae]|uniref:ABC transporter permease subunit n=1 Tax=Chengkuizengella axinellae TaxID=3064388 RepID=A0ABT9IY18_9BACL|nr:ABC transporter permease subunit [Chengkuizengella sp. 2205SS18-9]MDP5274138.1 ABC transporter permease subunit [Chengkuizengella sp. 2205SS18-9]
MRSLFKFELYKIFTQKSVWITFLIIFIGLPLLMMFSSSQSIGVTKEHTKAAYEKLEGDLSKERITKLQEELNEMDVSSSTSEEFSYRVTLMKIISEYDAKERINEKKIALEQEMQNISNASGAKYEQLTLEHSMLEKINFNETTYSEGPLGIIAFLGVGTIFTGILLIIGLSTIFSNEATTGMNQILLSSKHGRKKVTSAKLFAAVVYVTFIIGIQFIINIGINTMLYTSQGWSSPIHKLDIFRDSPYAFNLLEYFSVQMMLHTLFALGFAMLILLISSLSKTSVKSIIISSILFILPLILSSFRISGLEDFIRYSYYNMMKVDEFFRFFEVFHIFGTPVLEPIAASIVFTIISIVFTLLLYPIINRKQVS